MKTAGIVLGIPLLIGLGLPLSLLHTGAHRDCETYASGKGVEYESTTLPYICWIIVDGKKYTIKEYQMKFVGVKIAED